MSAPPEPSKTRYAREFADLFFEFLTLVAFAKQIDGQGQILMSLLCLAAASFYPKVDPKAAVFAENRFFLFFPPRPCFYVPARFHTLSFPAWDPVGRPAVAGKRPSAPLMVALWPNG